MLHSERRIKVGFIVDDIDRKAMGTALYMQKLIELIVKHHSDKIELVLISREGKGTHPVCKLARHITIPTFKLPKFSGVVSFMRWFFQNKEEFDIIHYPRPKLYPFFWKLKAKKTVVTFHDAPEKGSPRFRTPANYFWEWSTKLWFHRHIDAAISDAVFAAENTASYYTIPKEKSHGIVLGGGMDVSVLQDPSYNRERAQQKLADQYAFPFPYILQVARLVPHKNVHRLVAGFGILKNKYKVPHKLAILGGRNNTEAYNKVVDAEIEKYNIKDAVFFAPYVETEDMPLVYNCADIFVQVGTSDGFSIPLVDALKSGVPIVTSNRSVFPEIVQDAGLLADPFRPEDIAEKMHALLLDKDMQKRFVERGREVAKRYSWEQATAHTVELYQKLMVGKV